MTRIEELFRRRTLATLAAFPEILPEIVARHYASSAAIASALLKIVAAARFGKASENANQAMLHLLEKLAQKHAEDFGKDPAWLAALVELKEHESRAVKLDPRGPERRGRGEDFPPCSCRL